ncbi:MAG: serine/threonine-protein kinase [Phycisphaerae bacterium]|nr:serine/threonine-protein kinase [Phycisphaerae bacterium]
MIEAGRQDAQPWKNLVSEPPGGVPSPSPNAFPGYEIIGEIHRGGQGIVYKAIQVSTRRIVAVKVLLEGALASEQSHWRFEREVKLIAALRHPNIVVIHDSGIAQGRYYFAMEYVPGPPFDTHVRLAKLSVREIVELFCQVCDAVSYAHRHGVIHRDLKPSNILVGEDGKPQVLDFGLAKATDDEVTMAERSLTTMPGQLLGTLRYMSPEQAKGVSEAIDTRTDVYALGVILYEVLAGVVPYATNVELASALRNIQDTDPVRPSRHRREVNSELDAIVLKAMHKDPDRRYPSAAEFCEELKAWLDGRPVTAKSDNAFYVLRKLAVRHYFQTSMVAALIAAVVGFGLISFQLQRRTLASEDSLKRINQDFATYITELEGRLGQAAANTGQHLLGYFLLEWHAGHIDAAREIQRQIPRESPEFAVAAFLLDDGVSEGDLRATPKIGESLVLFAVGERHLKAGEWDEAKEAFAQYARQYRGLYLPLVEARLQEIARHTER